MVEAAGIEPASEKVRTKASTRLARSVFYLTDGPLNGKWTTGQPVHLAPSLRASRRSHPDLMAPRRKASGGRPGRRHDLSRECKIVVADYL